MANKNTVLPVRGFVALIISQHQLQQFSSNKWKAFDKSDLEKTTNFRVANARLEVIICCKPRPLNCNASVTTVH